MAGSTARRIATGIMLVGVAAVTALAGLAVAYLGDLIGVWSLTGCR